MRMCDVSVQVLIYNKSKQNSTILQHHAGMVLFNVNIVMSQQRAERFADVFV